MRLFLAFALALVMISPDELSLIRANHPGFTQAQTNAQALIQAPPDASVPQAIRHVPVPVVVRDSRDRALPALTATDFQVRDRETQLRIVDLTYVPAVAEGNAPLAPPPADAVTVDDAAAHEPGTRVFAFYLDEYHVAPEATERVRELVGGFIREHTSERDLFMVVKPLDPVLSLTLQRGRAAALAAVASFEGREGMYEPRSSFERDLLASDPVRLDRSRARIAVTAIQAVVTRLSRLGPSRKAFLVVSDGVSPATGGSGRTSGAGVSVDSIVRAANRGNVSVSTLIPRLWTQLEPSAANNETAGLAFLAELVRLTDGRRLGAAGGDPWPTLASDLGGYYVVTVDGADDGQFHPLAISVSKPGARVRTRPGYWAIAGDEIARVAKAMAPKNPRPVLPPLRNSRLILPWIGQERGEPGQTRLTFVWEPAPSRAGERARMLPSRLLLIARTLDGVAVYEGMVEGGPGGMGTLGKARFEVPPGRVRLEMSIEDASARVIDTDVRDVIVGGLVGPLAFGTPRVYRARTAREFNALAGDADAAPAAARAFPRGERLLLRVPFYEAPGEPGADAAEVSASLVNHLGQVMRTLPILRGPDSPTVTTDLPLAGLAAGDYSVRWRARRGSDEIVETVSLRITS